MEIGPPDQKRPRLGPAPSQWQNSPETLRQLPPPSTASYPSPFSRPPEPQPHPPPHPLDRRPSGHNDHPPYDPQDPRRPHSGPSHGYSHHTHQGPPHPPPYSGQRDSVQRDPMVKRDPSDEPSQPQYRRSPPGNPQDHNLNPSPHHEGPGRPYHHLPPFEHPPGPPQYRTNSYPPPQSPMSASESYSAHSAYGPSGVPPSARDPYASVSYPQNNAPRAQDVKRKAQRAAQACDSCRTLKAKCDEGRPSCSSCREKGMECRYRDPPPKQQDKASADMMDSLLRIENVVTGLRGEFTHFSDHYTKKLEELDRAQQRVEQVLLRTAPNAAANLKEETQDPAPILMPAFPRPSISSEAALLQPNESPYATPGNSRLVEESLDSLQQDDVGQGEVLQDEVTDEDDGGDPGPPKPPSIPINHTTGAARLLMEPAIKKMISPLYGSKVKNERYPIMQEGKRGLLRLFGRGEGTDAPPGYDRDTLIDHGSDSTPGDTHSDASSPAPAGEEWGQMGGLTPPGNPPPEFTRGGISQEGMPDFSRDTVLELVKSYKEHMNNMHPILIPSRLDMMVENFLKSLPESQARPKQVSTLAAGHGVSAGFIGAPRNPESPGNKRKRSPGLAEHQEIPNFWDQHKPGHPFRSISAALVLLVMALGKICLHKGKIPDVVSDRDLDALHSPVIRNGHPPSPLQTSPSMSSLPSPQDGTQSRSRRTSIEGAFVPRSNHSRPKNLDVIPGLAYFAFATDVIGNQLGGNSLQHVHVNILAGLYHGQLARVMESHAYIHQACRGLQVILRPKLDRFKNIKESAGLVPAKDNPLIFAFWTCLQLESDIVAELPCPHSGILTFEEDMPGPNLHAAVNTDGFDRFIIESYSAQLFLRKHLNQLHNMFYKPESENHVALEVIASKTPGVFPTIDATEENLSYMDKIAPQMKWDEEAGVPATHILHARLRAKFYGARMITYRPFLLKILALNSPEKSGRPDEAVETTFKRGIVNVDINENATSSADIDPKAMGYARKCILALFHSTCAFHGVATPGTERLIVTNVWGTAHAQWGNLLTLQAAYMDPILNPVVLELVGEHRLRILLNQTIAFLSLVATPTSALSTDIRILKHIGNVTGLRPYPTPQGPNTSSSFSSTTTGDVHVGGHGT